MGGCTRKADKASQAPPPAPNETMIQLVDIARKAGLGDFHHETGAFGKKWFPETMGPGCGFIDYDNDGDLDILLIGGGAWKGKSPVYPVYPLRLYRNDGELHFTEVTREAGLERLSDVYAIGLTAADYDNDGDEDIYVTTLGKNLLLQNNGQGFFTDVAREAGVDGPPVWSSSALFFDPDRDGDLDLFVGNYVYWSPETDIWCSLDEQTKGYCTPEAYQGVPPHFYRNQGNGTFRDETEKAGFLPAPGKTLGVVELDYNRDGWPDLALANDTQPDQLYRNNGDGTFTDIGMLSGMAYDEQGKARAGMGIDAGFVDTTGQINLFVGNFSREMIGVYRYIGHDVFLERSAVSQIGRYSLQTLAFGLVLIDIDLDGDLDLFVGNGHVQPQVEHTRDGITYRQAPHLFVNDGTGIFHDVAPEAGLSQPLVIRGVAYGDVDQDGRVDILAIENNGPVHLWHNQSAPAAHFLRIKLQGVKSHPQGIGAEVSIIQGEHPLVQRVRTGGSYLSVSEKVLTFGLGPRKEVLEVRVNWPSGLHERFGPFPADQTITLVEGSGEPLDS